MMLASRDGILATNCSSEPTIDMAYEVEESMLPRQAIYDGLHSAKQ